MATFHEIRDRIIILGRAEYRYDRLVSDFAEHYAGLVRANYKTLPDIEAFRCWLRHLHVMTILWRSPKSQSYNPEKYEWRSRENPITNGYDFLLRRTNVSG